jgi:phosphoenolpyruvate-protein kinase (PTS system EI component)
MRDDQPAVLSGSRLSPGYGQGKAFVFDAAASSAPQRRVLAAHELEAELHRFRAALLAARHEVAEVRERVLTEIGESEAEIRARVAELPMAPLMTQVNIVPLRF